MCVFNFQTRNTAMAVHKNEKKKHTHTQALVCGWLRHLLLFLPKKSLSGLLAVLGAHSGRGEKTRMGITTSQTTIYIKLWSGCCRESGKPEKKTVSLLLWRKNVEFRPWPSAESAYYAANWGLLVIENRSAYTCIRIRRSFFCSFSPCLNGYEKILSCWSHLPWLSRREKEKRKERETNRAGYNSDEEITVFFGRPVMKCTRRRP